jgi:sulfate permease, SulP family
MAKTEFRFDRMEFAGSLGDLGTLIPLSVALMVITGLNVSAVLLMVGLFYLASGVYFRLPVPVQPLKLVSAIAIAYPAKITVSIMAAAGISFGLILLVLAATGIIDRMARFFTRPIVRGIQLGLGFILIKKGIGFILSKDFFIHGTGPQGHWNLILGLAAFALVLLLLTSRRFPAALVVVAGGIGIGIGFGALKGVGLTLGPTPIEFQHPAMDDFMAAFVLLVIPQIPLTLGNAVMGTTDTCRTLFGTGPATKHATNRAFATSMGLANLAIGLIGAMPMCHGAGGLAAHHRFGARTGGANLMIGAIFLVLALGFGRLGISLLSAIPNSILGVLLVFAGLELAMLIRDISEKNDLFVAFLIAGVGLATTNMGLAFACGILVAQMLKWRRIQL